MKQLLSSASALALMAGFMASAHADGVNFEDRTGPSMFPGGAAAQTLVYDFGSYSATFNGGMILTGETNQTTNDSSVYATIRWGTLANPLTVSFSAPIKNFQLDVLNAVAGNYRMADNAGHSVDFSLATTGGSSRTVGFAASGDKISISYLGNYSTIGWDFAIDNVTFNQALSVPEPETYALMLAGLLALAAVARKRRSQP